MNGSVLIADLHLTDRPVDEYRWNLFSQLEAIFSENRFLDSLWILGDLTEFKDYHSSRLVNRIVDRLWHLRSNTRLNEVHVIKGNHDGIDPNTPYFLFLNRIPWIKFYPKPVLINHTGKKVAILPHSNQPEDDWQTIALEKADFVLVHATFNGAIGENGIRLKGLPSDLFEGFKAKVFSGDIHVPQKVGRIEYVGSPYPIRFGDSFEGRAIAFPLGKRKDVPLPNIRKAKACIRDADELRALSLNEGDMLKVELILRESEVGQWHKEKQRILEWCRRKGIVFAGIELKRRKLRILGGHTTARGESPVETLRRYCAARNVEPRLTRLGVELLVEGDQ